MTYVLGITGGIASGKSTVTNYLKRKQIPVVDGDVIARQIVEKGQPALEEIIQEFGPEMVDANGQLIRKKLGALIFSDATKRQKLDALLDPFLREAISCAITHFAQQGNALIVVDLPLLFEAGYQNLMDGVAVVDVDEQQQVHRLMNRDQLSEEMARQRIESQMPLEQKRKLADFIFDNSQSKAHTQEQVASWLEQHFKNL